MAIPYPDWLPLAQKANKNRSSDVGFRTDQPAVGAPIYQKLTDDLKTTWTLTWLFQRGEDRAFEQWLRSPKYLDNGNQWFTMPINLGGSGIQVQELHFTADGYPKQTSDNNGVITWSATVISRGVINSDDDDSDIIVELPPIWWSWLDEIVNRDLPEYVVAPVVPDTSPINLAMVALDSRVNFTRAGAASYVGSNGLIQQAAANQWPLEYLGGVGRSEPEPASTNILLYSQTISAGNWTKGAMTLVNTLPSPDGGSTASKLVPNTTLGTHQLVQSVSGALSLGDTITTSVYAKANGYNVIQIVWGAGVNGISGLYANYDLSTGLTSGNAGNIRITALADGWYLCSATVAVSGDATTTANVGYGVIQTLTQGRSPSWSGDGVGGINVWGAQAEKLNQPTSYIATTSARLTRPTATATIPANGASAIKITYSTGETTTLPFGGASSIQIPAATKAWGTRYITLIEYLP